MVLKYPTRERKITLYLLPCSILFAIAYNIPRFLEFKTTSNILIEVPQNGEIIQLSSNFNTSDILSLHQNGYRLQETFDRDFRRHTVYVHVYLFWGRLLLVELMPYIAMLIISLSIRRKVLTLSSPPQETREEQVLMQGIY